MEKIREYAKEILNLYNYFNGAIIFNKDAVAVYYFNNRKDINSMTESDVLGKHISQIYPQLDLTKSTIIEALTKGTPTANMVQNITTFKGQQLKELNTTVPIFDEGEVIGAVEVSKYIVDQNERVNIYITPMLSEKKKHLYTPNDIVSQWPGMKRIKEIISKVANTDSSVLIYGKTGTGKEMIAESMHSQGKRKNKRFISQNCAAIPSNLLESILFGTIKGSFTGAENKIGILEAANGGTIFLDEINTMEASAQSKILKAIEEQQITKVGDVNPLPIDVRIIAASNQDPWELVKNGVLRTDLYYRLKVIQIDLPSLEERKEDILLLTKYFIKMYNKVMEKNVLGLSPEVENFFMSYNWPGNVRELKNTIEGCLNFTNGSLIKMDDITWYEKDNYHQIDNYEDMRIPSGNLKENVKAYEKKLIMQAILNSDDITQVLDTLGITRQNFNNKVKDYNLGNYIIKK